jgi:hypothetical protein
VPVPSPVSGVLARIGRIESTFAPIVRTDAMEASSSGDFEPFGEAYQRAVAEAGGRPRVDAAAPDQLQVATPLPTRLIESMPDTRPTAWYSPSEAAAIGAVGTSLPTGAAGSAHRIGGFGSMPVPADLASLGNGRIPSDRLQPIAQSGHRLYGPAAVAWDGLVSAAAADGVEMRITDSYRSYDQQVDLAHRKGLYKNGGLAATPGTSNHGWGLAVDADVRDPAALAWIRANGPRFGFVEAVPREPWHWEYRPQQV